MSVSVRLNVSSRVTSQCWDLSEEFFLFKVNSGCFGLSGEMFYLE